MDGATSGRVKGLSTICERRNLLSRNHHSGPRRSGPLAFVGTKPFVTRSLPPPVLSRYSLHVENHLTLIPSLWNAACDRRDGRVRRCLDLRMVQNGKAVASSAREHCVAPQSSAIWVLPKVGHSAVRRGVHVVRRASHFDGGGMGRGLLP